MATPTAQDFIKAQHYSTNYPISIVLFFLNILLFAYSASHSYPHIITSISFTTRLAYDTVYPHLYWLNYWVYSMAMALYNLSRESDGVVAKRYLNLLNKARRHKEKQVAAKPMPVISEFYYTIPIHNITN